MGATEIFNAKEDDVADRIRKMTGNGVDVFIDAAGVQASFTTGIKSLRNGGTAVLVALFGQPVTHDAFDQTMRELTIIGTAAYRNIFPEVIALISSGRLPVDKLITSVIELDKIVEKGFETLINNPSEVKILVDLENG